MTPTMPDSVLIRALQTRKLNATEQLFFVDNFEILTELHPALLRIKQLLNDPEYVTNVNDQQIVELVLSRITAAIRETNCIEAYCPALIDLLELCLNHYMTTVYGSLVQDSPHCKIVLEILNALFLHHNKRQVMTLAVPATFSLFDRTDSDSLINSATSYLSLSAIHNAKILAQCSLQLVKNILKGHHSLVTLLPHVYVENQSAFNAHIVPLLRLLYNPATKINEKLSLLQFAYLVAQQSPDLIIPLLCEFDEFLLDPATCTAILQIFLSLINNGRVACLTGQLIQIRRAGQKSNCSPHNLLKMVQIVASIAKHSEQLRAVSINDIMCIFCPKLSGQLLLNALREVENIAEQFPHSILPYVNNIQKIAEQHPITFAVFVRIKSITSEVAANELPTPQNAINYLDSVESLSSKRSSHAFPSDPAPFNQLNEQAAVERSIGELDRNMKNLADRMRSTGSLLGQPRSRSFWSLNAQSTNRMVGNEECHNCAKDTNTTPRTSSEVKSTNRHSLVSSSNPFARPQHPSVPYPTEKTPLPPQIPSLKLGQDGRVRPVRALPTKIWSEALEPTNTTTTFPVFAATKRNTLSGSQIRMVDEHSAAVNKSRQQSSDTLVGRTSRTNSEYVQNANESVKNDVVRQFIEHRSNKICRYIYDFNAQYPIPVKCTIEGPKGGKSRMIIHFACQAGGPHCIFNKIEDLFAYKTKMPEAWLHLMFLHVVMAHMSLTNGQILDQSSVEFQTLETCWNFLPKNVTKQKKFSTVVTAQFPSEREKLSILKELQNTRFFDNFTFDARINKWVCFTCSNPDRIRNLTQPSAHSAVLFEGQLKQKKHKLWFNRWHRGFFRLSSAALTCTNGHAYNSNTYNGRSRQQAPIDLSSIRSLSRGRKNRKSLASTFEIETDRDKYVLKASDKSKADEWFNFLQLAVSQAKQQKQQPRLMAN